MVGAETSQDVEHALNKRAEDAGISREELDEAFSHRKTPVGTYEELRQQFAEMESSGITRFYLQGGYEPEQTPVLIDALSL